MDPNATLQEMLEIARADQSEFHEDIHRLCELVLAMDTWMSGGGFLPAAWNTGRVPTPEQRDKGYRTDAGHPFEPMPGDDTCMYVLVSGERCMKYAGDHR
ncbi:hypothetical protein SEA_MITHRIL_86 [Mycobacterium phage Mithril]|uniref:Uncharacterized protein n=1 Tax=Mycobacterium phage Mithril TaxID=2653765 RepID=A0A5Q2WRE7_9CAUD|nr:hypothetical protein SEA_MITHRIL_86 [Mycobacterium phage Mithril]QJD51389.1 hypothetical protein SEA_RAWRGERTHAT_86 [Mycobacterium phage RawrgerThat]